MLFVIMYLVYYKDLLILLQPIIAYKEIVHEVNIFIGI